jgi:hypothetical protein
MSWRRKRDNEPSKPVAEPDPIVYDIYGVPLGVRIAGVEPHGDETRAARHLARVTALRATRELEGREWISLGLF